MRPAVTVLFLAGLVSAAPIVIPPGSTFSGGAALPPRLLGVGSADKRELETDNQTWKRDPNQTWKREPGEDNQTWKRDLEADTLGNKDWKREPEAAPDADTIPEKGWKRDPEPIEANGIPVKTWKKRDPIVIPQNKDWKRDPEANPNKEWKRELEPDFNNQGWKREPNQGWKRNQTWKREPAGEAAASPDRR